MCIYIYICVYIYIYMYIYIYIFISIKRIRKFVKQTLCFLFFVTLSQHILLHTLVTLVSYSPNLFQLLLLYHWPC